MGDIVHIESPFEGDTFDKTDSFCAVESVKTSAEVYSPADLEVIRGNENLEENPSLVNEDPEGEGWLAEVKIPDSSQLGKPHNRQTTC